MDLDVKTPEAKMPENQDSKKADTNITINSVKEATEPTPASNSETSAPTPTSENNSTASNQINDNSAETAQGPVEEVKPDEKEEKVIVPTVGATKPVPAGNILDTTKDGTETAKQVHADAQAESQRREEELAKLAQSSQPNPTMPSTDGIKGQSMAEVVTGLDQTNTPDATSDTSNPATQPQVSTAENQGNQTEPQKKPGFFGRLFGKK